MPHLPDLPRSRDDDFAPEPIAARRALAERAAGRALPLLAGASVAPAEARGNVENLIGFAQVPLGLAGPLIVDTSSGPAEVYVPMATSEGALVAAHSRGMRLLRAGGGARSRVVREGLTQNPILVYDDAAQAIAARDRTRELVPELERLVERRSRHGRLRGVAPEVVGNRLIVRLAFTTGDAIGINMAAGATDEIARAIAEATGARARYVHGQDVEKRANARALIEGRGRSVVADVTVPRAALAELTRATPEDLVAIQRSYAVGFAPARDAQLAGAGRQRPRGGDARLRAGRGLRHRVRHRAARLPGDPSGRPVRQRHAAFPAGRDRRRRLARRARPPNASRSSAAAARARPIASPSCSARSCSPATSR